MIVGDLLHVFNLGIGRDLAGTILRTILGDRIVFSASTLEDRMEQAYASLRAYARTNGHTLKLKKFTRSRLTWKSNRYPELVASGSDVHIICTWLEEVLNQHVEQYQQFMTVLSASNRALRLLYSAGPFPTPGEKETVRVLGELFAKSFVQLSAEAVENHALLWRCRPKFHVLTEIFLMRRSINPVLYSTWMDEDFLRKLSHTLRLTSNRTAQTRILQRWLMAIPEQLHRSRQPNWKKKLGHHAVLLGKTVGTWRQLEEYFLGLLTNYNNTGPGFRCLYYMYLSIFIYWYIYTHLHFCGHHWFAITHEPHGLEGRCRRGGIPKKHGYIVVKQFPCESSDASHPRVERIQQIVFPRFP